ncbi:MAG: histidine phosphatase family protein [Proteobacteria bacterium]|nr:histidine phosphatase family protein [Pseudomonadota bacterium]
MSLLGLIRHGRTAWNSDGRMTGRADIALTEAGRLALAGLHPPEELDGATWHVSPLIRARQTAAILSGSGDMAGGMDDAGELGANALHIEARLIEMDFGAYEGRSLEELRADPAAGMVENEHRGLDFLPPGGESPRMVQERLRPFLAELGQAGGRHIAVAHKSVIRAIFAAAYDWNMLGRPPVKLLWDRAHLFNVDGAGAVRPWRMNVPLRSRHAPVDQAAAP